MTKNKLYGCGTVRKNRKGLPKFKAKKELRRGDSNHAVRADGICCVCWKDKRCTQLLLTFHKGEEMTHISRKEKYLSDTQVTCPNVVVEYNTFKGCIDKAVKLIYFYTIDRKSRKW